METTETTLTGNKLWIVVGILGFIAILIVVGIFVPAARPYIDGATKFILSAIPMIAK